MAEEFHQEDLELNAEGQGAEDMEDASAELEAMKARLQEMEKEAAKLKEMQDKVQKEAGMAPAGSGSVEAGGPGSKEEVDSRSVYVGNVDYACTPEELQMHFQDCGTVNRVTILTDKMGNPKGFAYIEFLEVDAVAQACLLEGTELRGRQLKVSPKRTNVPGMKQRGRGRGRGRGPPGFFPMMPMMPPPFMYGYGYGYAPRGRGRGRGGYGGYAPY